MEEEFSIFVSVYSWFILGDLLFYALTCRSCCRRFHRQLSNVRQRAVGKGEGKKYYPKRSVGLEIFFQSSYTLATKCRLLHMLTSP